LLAVVAECGGGGGGAQQQEEQKATPPVTGNFVGEAPDEEAFVALVAASPEDEEGQEREAMYLTYLKKQYPRNYLRLKDRAEKNRAEGHPGITYHQDT
jgi:hypothetical protein